MNLSDQQIDAAISACERIQRACEKQDRAIRNIARIFDNMANGRDPSDGLEPHDEPAGAA